MAEVVTTKEKKTVAKSTGKKATTKIVAKSTGIDVENSSENAPALGDLKGSSILDSFVFMDDTKKVLDIAYNNGKNVILYGPGGYGKSEYTQAYLEEKGIEPFVFTMGTGTTTDRLFGGLDLPAFNASGKIQYLIENSFMNYEYVIFEELFDAPDYILEQLKDILSSGKMRNGSQVFNIKTKVIVCCTNKTREEFSKTTSLKALMERFPLEHKVIWKDHNRITYEQLFVTKNGFADPMLTYVLEQYASAGNIISPRIAIAAADIISKSGPEALSFIADFSVKPDLLKSSVSKFNGIIEITKKTQVMLDLVKKFEAMPKLTASDLKKAAEINKQLFVELTAFKAIKADDSLASSSAETITKYTTIYDKHKKIVSVVSSLEGLEGSDDNSQGF